MCCSIFIPVPRSPECEDVITARIPFAEVKLLFANVPLHSYLLVRLESVIPLQLIQSDRSPFFTSYTIKRVLKSFGIFLEIQILWKLFSRMVDIKDSTAFNNSVLMSTSPCRYFVIFHLFDGLDFLD